MSYFQSEIVNKEFQEMFQLEDELVSKLMTTEINTKERLMEIKKLIEKQKIVYTRLSLSDDPAAKEYKKKFDEIVSKVFSKNDSVINIYNAMEDYITSLEESM
jgi:hypothetical protein